MNLLPFLLLIAAHFFTGWGILKVLGVKPPVLSLEYTFVAVLLGIGIFCLLPPVLEMLSVPINKISLASIICAVIIVPLILWIRALRTVSVGQTLRSYARAFKLYDLVFLGILLYLLYPGIFKCIYFPPTPRDFTSGAEAIAEYTLKEQKINNSYFTVDLFSTDNHQKPPFLLGLQIIYKSFVQPFGQVWLIPMAFSFLMLFYLLARRLAHPVFAAMVTLLMVLTPEFHAYLIVMPLFDVPNTIYVFIGFYYLFCFFRQQERKSLLLLSATGFGLATLARPETLLLAGLVASFTYVGMAWQHKKIILKTALFSAVMLVLFPLLIDVFAMEIFVKHFIPSSLSISSKLNPNLSDFGPFFERLSMLINGFMFPNVFPSKYRVTAPPIFGETFHLMAVFIMAEIAFLLYTRKIDYRPAAWFLFMVLVFIFLGFIGYLLLWTDQYNAKRGIFKLIPLIYFFILSTRPLQFVSDKLKAWEAG